MLKESISASDYYDKFSNCSKIEKDVSNDEYEAPFSIYKFRNAKVFYNGVFATEDFYPISDHYVVSDGIAEAEDVLSGKNPIECINLKDSEYISLLGKWKHNLWHWTFETLVYVIIAEAFGFKGKYIVKSDVFLKNKLETLTLLGIAPERILVKNKEIYFLIDNVSVVEKLDFTDERFLLLLSIIREKFLKSIYADNLLNIPKKERKIYISREKVKNSTNDTVNGRYIYNEDEVWELLKNYGFEKIYMEDFSIKDQIKMASETSFLIGGHGSGILHSLFMPEKSKIIELFSPVYINFCSSKLPVKLLKHDYRMLLPQICETYPHGTYHNSPVEVDVEYLEIILDNMYD
ncbi:MAG: glycosyltransferase family 61 protein [Candidatus Sericytochromatia bacterium]